MKTLSESQVISAMGALSQETRLRIVRFLVGKGDIGATAGEISKAMDVSPSRLSFHLANLDHSGLVTSRRQSRNIIYQINFAMIGGVINYLLTDCCKNNPEVLACCEFTSGSVRC